MLFFFSRITQKRIIKYHCNHLDIKLIGTSFKIGSLLSVEDAVASVLHRRVLFPVLPVQIVLPITSEKRASIFHPAFVST